MSPPLVSTGAHGLANWARERWVRRVARHVYGSPRVRLGENETPEARGWYGREGDQEFSRVNGSFMDSRPALYRLLAVEGSEMQNQAAGIKSRAARHAAVKCTPCTQGYVSGTRDSKGTGGELPTTDQSDPCNGVVRRNLR